MKNVRVYMHVHVHMYKAPLKWGLTPNFYEDKTVLSYPKGVQDRTYTYRYEYYQQSGNKSYASQYSV